MSRRDRRQRRDVLSYLRSASSGALLLMALVVIVTGLTGPSTLHFASLTLLGFAGVCFGLVQWTGKAMQRSIGAAGALVGLWPVVAAFGSWPRLECIMAVVAALAGVACVALEWFRLARR